MSLSSQAPGLPKALSPGPGVTSVLAGSGKGGKPCLSPLPRESWEQHLAHGSINSAMVEQEKTCCSYSKGMEDTDNRADTKINRANLHINYFNHTLLKFLRLE